ncbi:MAG: glutathione S-transferase [Hormoscilla sp. SP5CHS1]|nr:glutathione S-transferase [Hormoscilla sp. SP12CHS1]MBC6452831.1 glutathione S-transferase [Hormoscilla sp. SP5CHS1]MBC6474647.1 glutathione S-transferase [Hormoscilla sp. GM102CHS1]
MYKYTPLALLWAICTLSPARALPPPSDVPEEILRTEILTEARSPVDGQPLTAAEYALLRGRLQSEPSPKIDPQIEELIFLLRIRRAIRTIIPF